ncbi:MAG: hypothetical protein K2X81_13090 [Candidatus Obscuribacterales bacterium]|nr:hypothetical protein [Candidatus Obscuribacterales bacterium]
MTDTARDYQKIEPAAIEGLDQLFQDQDHVDLIQIQDQGHVELNQIQDQDQVELVPLAQAAKRLGVTRRYAHKLATSGKLQAIQDSKGRWLVKMEQGQIQIQDQVELIQFQDQDHVEPSQSQDHDHVELIQIQFQDHVIQGYQQQIKELQHKLEAAAYRVGYLQSQVETKDQELESQYKELENREQKIKLLTDSQHKPSWWNKFKTWFLGGP